MHHLLDRSTVKIVHSLGTWTRRGVKICCDNGSRSYAFLSPVDGDGERNYAKWTRLMREMASRGRWKEWVTSPQLRFRPWLAWSIHLTISYVCTSIKIQGSQKSLASFAHFHKGLSTHAREVAISPLVKPSRLATSVAVGKDNKLQLYLASLLLRKSRKSLFSNSNSAQNVSNSSSCLGLICHRPHQSHQSPPPPSGLPSTAHPGEPAKTTTKSEKCSLPLA